MSEAPYFIDVPSGRQLEEAATVVRVLPRASARAIERARRTWPEANAGDFERQGKLFVDRATGVAYRRVPGDPQLGGAVRADVATWYVSSDANGDGLVYLQKADDPSVVRTELGEVGGRRMTSRDVMR